MAIVANLVANFGATTRGFDTGTKRVQSGLASITTSVTRMIATMAPLAGGVLFAQMARNAERFTQKMNQSLAIMGDVSEETQKRMSDAAFKVARDTIFTVDQAAEAYFFLASAGMNAEQSIAAMPAVAAFAQAGMFSLSLATDLATDAQSALGLTVDDTEKNLENLVRVTDVLVKANTLANASVQQFSEALTTKAGASLRMVGKEIEEGVAVLAVFADQGVKGSDAGTALAIVLRDLQTKAIKFRKEFDAAGIAVFDQVGNMNNLADIVEDLEGKLGSMADEQKKATLLSLGFSDKSVIFIQSLIGMSEAIREYEEALKKAQGTTQQVSDEQLTEMQRSMAALGAEATELGVAINEQLVPSVSAFLQLLTNTLDVVGFAIPQILKWGVALLAGAAAAAILGKAMAAYTAIMKGSVTVQTAFLALLGPGGIAQIALAAAVTTGAVIAMNKALEETGASAEKTRKALADVEAARKKIEEGASSAQPGVGSFFTTEESGFDLTTVRGEIGELAKDIEGFVSQRNRALEKLAGFTAKFGDDITGAFDIVRKRLQESALDAFLRQSDAERRLAQATGPLVDSFGSVENAVKFLGKALDGLITPQQKFAEEQKKINTLMEEGFLAAAEGEKHLAATRERLGIGTEDQKRMDEQKKEREREEQAAIRSAEALIKSIRTPMQVLEDSIARINKLREAGLLTSEQRITALDALSKDIDEETPDTTGPQFGAALQAGSAEAFSAILAVTRPQEQSQRETAENTKKIADIAEENARIELAKEEQVPVTIPAMGAGQ